MSTNDKEFLQEILKESPEMKFDYRLLEKKLEHGFLTPADREKFLKSLSEESEFEFTSMDEVTKLDETNA